MLQLSRTITLRGPGYGFVRGICLESVVKGMRMTRTLTTSSWRNCKNLSDVTDPGMISWVIIPSIVKIGRIENLSPQTKYLLWTHLLPTNDHPLVRADVFLFRAASSMKINMSGFGTSSAILFMKAER